MNNNRTSPPTAADGDRYSDLLLLDLLDPDRKRFWARYKTDLFGFAAALAATLSMIGLLALIARIGS